MWKQNATYEKFIHECEEVSYDYHSLMIKKIRNIGPQPPNTDYNL